MATNSKIQRGQRLARTLGIAHPRARRELACQRFQAMLPSGELELALQLCARFDFGHLRLRQDLPQYDRVPAELRVYGRRYHSRPCEREHGVAELLHERSSARRGRQIFDPDLERL